ncbi:succinyl-diaminopimelate desuccinylase [Parendozoicomonas sp. Alg238-R29]|uniref:succinyl-diaminopimelate desuccinylase n=1 Tax=Parendozoicomonas sp. Alg238-R29 TaxID=2993446 RepID=UPI00248E3CFB|nr:succinyl-diaminopimelate desuccinylase [Parendozoicomonas sp. Alg238-R29]
MSDLSPTLQLACELISRPSVTPEDAGCQQLLIDRLAPLGFKAESMQYSDHHGTVDNLWLRKGDSGPLFVFAGHTDVVPSGPEEQWQFPPFEPRIHEGYLCGRGAADMKGSIASIIIAIEHFVKEYPDHQGSIALLITSDEEGPATCGTVKVIEALENRSEKIDWCLVGEPSSTEKVGDVIKNGRRGSLGAQLSIKGIQGHVAYPHLAENPVHTSAPAIAELATTEWDKGNEFFPPTSFQISNIQAGTGATNVIPGDVSIVCNFRFSTEQTDSGLRTQFEALLDRYNLKYDINWNLSGQPFLTAKGELVSATVAAIKSVCGYDTELSTAGGTSDGRFIAPTGAQVLELGPCNDTIHKINERVKAEDLNILSDIYEQILQNLLVNR